MDLLIKNIKMPSVCDNCYFNYDCYKCIITDMTFFGINAPEGFDSELERLPSCPLHEVDAHGRLIDIDLLPNYQVTGPVHAGENNLGVKQFILLPFSTINEIPVVLEASNDFVRPIL